ncbi:SDR family oxidoreductase [archaeon]|nr:MAG: SDR family oxidoreductase [archaeon]
MKQLVLFLCLIASSAWAERKVVLITGCSSGIGYSAALEFAKHSDEYKVWATMRDVSKSKLTDELSNLRVIPLDVTSDESVQSAVTRIIQEDGKIDIVINNAGYGVAGALETVSIEEAKHLFDVNVWGVVRVLQTVLPHMRSRRSGYVINISSTSGMRGIPCFEFYTGSKFAVEGITDSMRYSLSAYNISVTNVNAGPVKTSFTDRFGSAELGGKGTRQLTTMGESSYLQKYTDGIIAGLNYRMQSKEAQTADEVATLLVNLAHMKSRAKRITDIPFNIGSNRDSQGILEDVRKNPTGWGGVYSEILERVPALPPKKTQTNKAEL